jgi:transposase
VVEDLVPDSLWEQVAPLLPARAPRRRRFPGRLPVDDRVALAGIVYVLRTGSPGSSCRPRCSAAPGWPVGGGCGTGPRLGCGQPFTSCCSPSCAPPESWIWTGWRSTPRTCTRSKEGPCRAVPGQSRPPRLQAPPDRRRPRPPLAVPLTGGNRYDITQLLPLLDAIPPIRGTRGRPRRKPRELYADRGYDFDKYRRLLRERGIAVRIARRGVAHGSGLGKIRWVVERGFAWLHAFKRLRTRYERRADIHLGLLQLACALICHRQLPKSF